MLETDGLRFGYVRDADILNGISIGCPTGQMLAIIGPNGSGKSTLLKALAGDVQVREGAIRVAGVDVAGLSMHQRVQSHRLAYVPQSANVFSPLTVRENLLFGGWLLPAADRRQRLDELCAVFPLLARKMNDRANSFSGGERQVLALARALMPRPKLLLLDEPTAGLSPKMTEQFMHELELTRQREKVTIVMVEQNVHAALAAADRAVLLVQGRIRLDEPAADLAAREDLGSIFLEKA